MEKSRPSTPAILIGARKARILSCNFALYGLKDTANTVWLLLYQVRLGDALKMSEQHYYFQVVGVICRLSCFIGVS